MIAQESVGLVARIELAYSYGCHSRKENLMDLVVARDRFNVHFSYARVPRISWRQGSAEQ